METVDPFESTPVGSLVSIQPEERTKYLKALWQLPRPLFELLTSERTGAFCRGLTKSYALPESKSVNVAFVILKAGIGIFPLTQLSSVLSSELDVPNDQAQKMAQEIEHDLFGEVKDQLGQVSTPEPRKQKERPPKKRPDTQNLSNVLDLTSENKTTPPPPMPPPPKH